MFGQAVSFAPVFCADRNGYKVLPPDRMCAWYTKESENE